MEQDTKIKSILSAWKPTLTQMEKIQELKDKLIIENNTAIVIKAIGELYERETGKKW